jgi:hypothetical protein
MANFKIIEHTQTTLKCNTENVQVINDDYIDSLFNKYNVQNINLYPVSFSLIELENLRSTIVKYKTMKIAFFKTTGELQVFDCFSTSTLSFEKVKDSEQEQLLSNSISESFQTTLSFLSNEKKNNFRSTLMSSLTSGELWEVKVKKSIVPIGLILLKNFPLDEISSTLISWIWISEEVNAEKRKEIHNLFISKLKEEKNERILASIENLNSRSINFFIKLGFKPLCLFFQK